ncbi:MAG: GNAT family N-acetyltransferase [Alphaproteobacteria bacterium]
MGQDKISEIITPRLRLRRYNHQRPDPGDMRGFYKLNADWLTVRRYFPDGIRPDYGSKPITQDGFVIADKETNQFKGYIGLAAWAGPEENERQVIHYALLKKERRKGYAAESLHAICAYAFEQRELPRIAASVARSNARSHALLEGVGFEPLEEVPWYHTILDRYLSLPRERWKEQPDKPSWAMVNSSPNTAILTL